MSNDAKTVIKKPKKDLDAPRLDPLKMRVRLTLVSAMLGTATADPEVYKNYLAAQTDPEKAEAEARALPVDDQVEKGTTVFRRLVDEDTGKQVEPAQLVLPAYMIGGFLAEASRGLARVKGTETYKRSAYIAALKSTVFPGPDQIVLHLPAGKTMGICERPLRAQTAQGERIALARSESVPKGTTMELTITLLNPDDEGWIIELLHYGANKGLGQWRNGGHGKFTWERLGVPKGA